jgi:hypothetical protein
LEARKILSFAPGEEMLAGNIYDRLVTEMTVAPLPSLPPKCWPIFNDLLSHYYRFDNLSLLFLFSFLFDFLLF